MSVNGADNIECWSLMEFGCERTYTLKPRLLIILRCSMYSILTYISTALTSLLCAVTVCMLN